jgi:hypothetical protein
MHHDHRLDEPDEQLEMTLKVNDKTWQRLDLGHDLQPEEVFVRLALVTSAR